MKYEFYCFECQHFWETDLNNHTKCPSCDSEDIGLNDFDEPDDGWTDAEADADTLASAGMGCDEDYHLESDYEDRYSDGE